MQLIANILSGIGAILLLYSTFGKKKENILLVQALSATASAVSYLLAASYSAMLISIIAVMRNIIAAKGKLTPSITFAISIILVLLGLCANTRGLVGLFPIVASVEYTIWSARGTTAQSLRWAVFVNLALWLIHDICVSLYLFVAMDLIILTATVVNIVRNKPKRE